MMLRGTLGKVASRSTGHLVMLLQLAAAVAASAGVTPSPAPTPMLCRAGRSPDGTVNSTCTPGAPGCLQGTQCQSRADNPWMPIFHLIGNFTHGNGTQPDGINDVSSIIEWKGVLHVFHQFGQCGWAHAVSHDGAHWKNLRYPLTPDDVNSYDARGAYDGSLTLDPDVNGGEPLILYDIVPAAEPEDELEFNGGVGVSTWMGDLPLLGVARPSDPADPELTYWTKDPNNPVDFSGGPGASFPSQVWKNGDHFNFVANGVRFTTTDSSLHKWAAVNVSEGWPGGGNGGQWFQKLPAAIDNSELVPAAGGGRNASAARPNYLVNVRNGNQYVLGTYTPENETFQYSVAGNHTACSCCPFPPTCLVEQRCAAPAGHPSNRPNCTGGTSQIPKTDSGHQFTWAAIQNAGGRMMNIAWVDSFLSAQSAQQGQQRRRQHSSLRGTLSTRNGGGPPGPPNSALSLIRELMYDPYTSQLVANPLPELSLLHMESLFRAAAMTLQPGKLVPLPLAAADDNTDHAVGAEIDVNASFVLQPAGTVTSFGVGVLANNDSLSESAVIRINITSDPAAGGYKGSVRGGIEPAAADDGQGEQALRWEGEFLLSAAASMHESSCGNGVACVDVRVLVDRSIVEVFVAGGRVASLMAYQPPDISYTNVHLFAQEGAAVVQAKSVEVKRMGCGWV